MLWKNKNNWVFNNVGRQHSPISLARLVTEEYNMIKIAKRRGAVELAHAARS
jgi:hypothetical protein